MIPEIFILFVICIYKFKRLIIVIDSNDNECSIDQIIALLDNVFNIILQSESGDT